MNYTPPRLYRKRYIPNENIWLKNDEIIHIDENIIMTKWKTIKPRLDFSHGYSCYYLKEGIKISRFFDEKDKLLYNYCDIIETCYDKDANSYTFNDLLADVIVYENGKVEVVDLAEISDALDMEVITIQQAKKSLKILDKLLNIIYGGKFEQLTKPLEKIEDRQN